MKPPLAVAALGMGMALLAMAGCSSHSGADVAATSPLAEYLSGVWSAPGLSESQQVDLLVAREYKRQEMLSECMAEKGFEYIPHSAIESAFEKGADRNPDDADWVSKYGYGINTSPLSGTEPPQPDDVSDPNELHLAALSEPEQSAYRDALFGSLDAEAASVEGATGSSSGVADTDGSSKWVAGCTGSVETALDEIDPSTSDIHRATLDAVRAIHAELLEGEHLSSANAEWASCMSNAGHPDFTRQVEAESSTLAQRNEYLEGLIEGEKDDVAFQNLKNQEVKTAFSDLECRQKTNYNTKKRDALHSLEAQFLQEHLDELKAIKVAAEGLR